MKNKEESQILRLTCPPCGEVFAAPDEDDLISLAVDHAQKFHDMDLLRQFSREELRQLVERENDSYWSRIAHLIPNGQLKTVLDEKLCQREREIVSYVVHGFANRDIAKRLFISERTVSTHLVNIYEKLNVHSRAELTALVRASDRIIEAGLRAGTGPEFGPFLQTDDSSAHKRPTCNPDALYLRSRLSQPILNGRGFRAVPCRTFRPNAETSPHRAAQR